LVATRNFEEVLEHQTIWKSNELNMCYSVYVAWVQNAVQLTRLKQNDCYIRCSIVTFRVF